MKMREVKAWLRMKLQRWWRTLVGRCVYCGKWQEPYNRGDFYCRFPDDRACRGCNKRIRAGMLYGVVADSVRREIR